MIVLHRKPRIVYDMLLERVMPDLGITKLIAVCDSRTWSDGAEMLGLFRYIVIGVQRHDEELTREYFGFCTKDIKQ
jgi:hypothetical protein